MERRELYRRKADLFVGLGGLGVALAIGISQNWKLNKDLGKSPDFFLEKEDDVWSQGFAVKLGEPLKIQLIQVDCQDKTLNDPMLLEFCKSAEEHFRLLDESSAGNFDHEEQVEDVGIYR